MPDRGGEDAVETVKGPDSRDERIESMVALYQLPLLRLCYAYLHDEELAKDAVQEPLSKHTETWTASGGRPPRRRG